MTKTVRLLLVEDNELDAAHVTMTLRRDGLAGEVHHVDTRQAMLDALKDGGWDVVICDYHLPGFSAPEALELLKGSGMDVPFIVISGAVGEETAVELMRAGPPITCSSIA